MCFRMILASDEPAKSKLDPAMVLEYCLGTLRFTKNSHTEVWTHHQPPSYIEGLKKEKAQRELAAARSARLKAEAELEAEKKKK